MGRHHTRSAYPLLPPPRGPGDPRPDDRKVTSNGHTRPPTTDDKVGALKAYRRAQGLCYICADRWAPGHKCAATVQLHAVEEVFAMLSHQSVKEEEDAGSQATSDNLMCLLSHEAHQGAESTGTIRLLGHMQGQDLLMLIDSGSSSSFISSAVAARLQGVQSLSSHTSVKIANGGFLQSNTWIPACE